MNNKELIIWDWNGTLLNDVDACVDAMNIILAKRDMPMLDHNRYKSIFRFPVQEYYKDLGFDFSKESFEDLSVEYIDLYVGLSKQSDLHQGAIDVLEMFKNQKINQIILSAAEQKALEMQVNSRSIRNYFNDLIGLDNIYAKSKVENAKNYIKSLDLNPQKITLIGDTWHDLEVAKEINCSCILINNGHQNIKAIKDFHVIQNISELLN